MFARQNAIRFGGSGDTVVVEATGALYGNVHAVLFEGDGGVNRLINHGTIDAASSAITDDSDASG